MVEGEPKKLFKFYLDQNMAQEANRPLFFRRMYRWRNNAMEYAVPFSKKGLARGYMKYGLATYLTWHYTKKALFGEADHGHGHGHDAHHWETVKGAIGNYLTFKVMAKL